VALTAENFDTAVEALETRTGPAGEPLGLSADLLVCGPALRATAEEIVAVQYSTGGASNRHYNRRDLLVLPRFGSSTAWFVMDTSPVRPMVLQDREGPEFAAKDTPTDDDAFYRELYAYKARRRCAVAILAPWLIQASIGA
jgi:phage major head subunit gpT-like protein